jgi:hypothetical protein
MVRFRRSRCEVQILFGSGLPRTGARSVETTSGEVVGSGWELELDEAVK